MQQKARVTAADIARLAGVGRAAVSNWRKRYDTFPAPVGGTAASPQFDLDQIEQWLAAQGKLPAVADEDRLWRSLLAAAGDPAEVLATAGDHLLGRVPLPYEDLRAPLDALASTPRAALESLWDRFADLPGQRAVTTPDALADVMVELARVREGKVLDPACGTGRLLRAAARAGATTLYGQDVDGAATRLAALWLAAHDLDGEIRTDDSLRRDAFPSLVVDAVVANLPFGLTNWGHEELGYDRRWEFGVPPRTEPELAWVQHALAHLAPGGRAVLLMPPSAASRRAGRRIRAELLRRGALRAIVALPLGAAAPHGVNLHLWVLEKSTSAVSEVRLLDTTSDPIERAYERIRDLEAGGYAIPVIDLLDDEVDLTPGRYGATVGSDEISVFGVRESRDDLVRVLKSLPGLLPVLAQAAESSSHPPSVTLAELIRAGALQLLGPVRVGGAEASSLPVLTSDDVLEGRHATGRADTRPTPQITVKPGDVVVPIAADHLLAWVVSEGEALLGRNLHLLRCDASALDPWFLAGYLRTSANKRQAGASSASQRYDVRKAQVPRIPIDEQRRHGEVFRNLQEFDAALRAATLLGGQLARRTADGLAGGLLSVTVD
ncbi:N-6 DNA methylase [Actinoplanes bogorensis]|uniref:N-6 DNA methylase n=1 Tax=Paractinoplanes bogorensis TaxID=1610840 RepID=A0ABS5YXW8_9ACTN|nr:N-6 DNA methylase [Actinoplanes bogorensis]MBU2668292.1 N-6 DNA methylase [Actinoplanes bogorensis]